MSLDIRRRDVVLGSCAAAFGVSALGAGTRRSFADEAAGAAEPRLPPLAERLADYAARLRYEDIDAATIETVKAHVIDTIGCAIAAFDERPVRICRDIALSPGRGGGLSTVIGTNKRTSPDLATFANGAAARYLDLNDVYVARQASHPSGTIAACLAIAETERASVADLITAIVLAYEINCRLLDAFDLSARGWDGTVFTLPATALAAGKLMTLVPAMLTQAVNIALNDHIPMGQTRTQTLSDWKGIADAEAGRNAVFAALLARGGLTGPSPVFEGRAGFFRLVSGPIALDVGAFGGRGAPFRIHQCALKSYPAQVYTQTAIVAAVDVVKEAGGMDNIVAVDIATTHRGYQMAGSEPEKWTPGTRDTADHSLPYIVARAMADGEIANDSYTPEKLHDPGILAFMRNITVKEDPAFATLRASAPPTRITARLRNGASVVRQVEKMPGFGGEPTQRADVERKFRSNVRGRWPQERIEMVLQSLWSLDRTNDIAALMTKLSLESDL